MDRKMEFQESRTTNPFIFAAFVLWGMSSWITINSIFVELPTFAISLPEGWALGSQLGLVAQISNIFPLCYFLIARSLKRKPSPSAAVFALLLIGTLCSPLLGFFWFTTTYVLGTERSVWLLGLTLTGGIVDCTTSLVFWPFVASYKTIYVTALAVGEGLSGGCVSVIGLLQDQGGAHNFGVRAFFILVTIVMALSAAGFAVVRYSKSGKHEMIENRESSSHLQFGEPAGEPLLPPEVMPLLDDNGTLSPFIIIAIPLAVLFTVNLVENGMVPSITSYAFLPFPEGLRAMSISINIALILSPLASFLTTVARCKGFAFLSVLCSIPTIYVLYTSLDATVPLFGGTSEGMLIVVIAYIVMRALLAYTKTMALVSIRDVIARDKLETAYFYCGFMTQLGSGVGALLFFVLVNFTGVFRH